MRKMACKLRASGFSLVELLITLAVSAILLTIAVSSFSYVTKSNTTTSETNGLLGDLQFARAEAIKEGVTVTACAAAAGATKCGAVTAWQNGWIVFSDPANLGVAGPGAETILKVQSGFSSTDTFTASNNVQAVTFNREGYAIGIPNGTLIVLKDSTANKNFTRCLSVTLIGLIASERYGAVNNGVTCQ